MAYEFDLETDPDPPFTDNLGVETVEFALGYDIDADVAVVMSVMLVPVDDPKAHDLRFGIREQSLTYDWRVSAPDYSQEAVNKYIPKEWRASVRLQLMRSVRTLVGQIEPENITMETYYSGLEQKALQKYEFISVAVHRCGYETADQFRDDSSQKDHWLFTKRV
ncbi:hypothetical protein [Bradyrhizobium stylosanthis]|uniref:Uncharacterized protein n=1 Tax=Bradyrhizobium stylosanthis TaxID=1803665 RepID=A0A560DKB1_9BRAD|nr:hypothetical protein [Bradyrhizobium stylosanthis]TWA97537.1 hypothetical protein FBZ96_106596 [Bradyrhizobium stylosanthis]